MYACKLARERNHKTPTRTNTILEGSGCTLLVYVEVPSFLLDDQGVKGKGADFLFLFLPRKEMFVKGACRTWDAWSLLTLKEIGWVPPTMQAENMAPPILWRQSVC